MDCSKNVSFLSRRCCNAVKALSLHFCLIGDASIMSCQNGAKKELLQTVKDKYNFKFLKSVGPICEANHHVPCSGIARTLELGVRDGVGGIDIFG